ncbi:MAG: hypothetical protein QMD14_02335 [Candidatus Aenigmarchaeota archaeon]|nr:hypothetical protein [Candidatus Aenigmarchaeota archaeon]
MKFTKQELKELEEIKEAFYRVLKGLDVLRPSKDGIISAFGRRLLLIDSETFAIPPELIGPIQNRVMYHLGLEAGEAIAKGLERKPKPIEKLKIIFKLLRRGGIKLLKDAKRTEVTKLPEIAFKCWGYAKYAGWSSPISTEIDLRSAKGDSFATTGPFEAYAKIKRGWKGKVACYFIAGTVTGLYRHWFGRKDIEGKETECRAKGDKHCHITIHPTVSR